MKIKKIYSLIAILVAIVVIISTLYYVELKPGKTTYTFYYNVEIQSFKTVNSSVIVPLPAFLEDEDYWIDELLLNSIKQGYMNVTRINTEYGNGLMLNASSNCRFIFSCDEKVPVNDLAMSSDEHDTSAWYHFYSDYDNSTSSLSVDVDMYNFEYIDEQSTGPSISIHIFPSPMGWFEYPAFTS